MVPDEEDAITDAGLQLIANAYQCAGNPRFCRYMYQHTRSILSYADISLILESCQRLSLDNSPRSRKPGREWERKTAWKALAWHTPRNSCAISPICATARTAAPSRERTRNASLPQPSHCSIRTPGR